ncbi:hypothetical protein K239x_44130 [Planctomycetes bacterium K23_9]|uniref:Uncharacterized protein n=1 Tax=Stieleria marina TaxID=1930275 RepID=A0A517NZ73_9BACT|nr:hypothetical protein K239x_44130 [Planctomycetes bacterium K23_9]
MPIEPGVRKCDEAKTRQFTNEKRLDHRNRDVRNVQKEPQEGSVFRKLDF